MKTKKEQEIQAVPVQEIAPKQEAMSVEVFIAKAIESGLSIEHMEKLFTLREKVKAEQAHEAFTEAMAQFQAVCPVIEKTKKVLNKDGRTVRYQYAPLDVIISQIQQPLAKSGLSYSWDVKNNPGFMTAVATITHRLGHTQSSEFTIPIDMDGFMTAPQKYASAQTFAKRYALCNVLGIATGDEDDDSLATTNEKEALSLKSKIIFLLKELGEKTDKPEDIKKAIQTRTGLENSDKNLADVKSRLEVIVKEMREYEKNSVQQ
jgi:hypothetical protein